ncbi:hypothetical protein HDU79_006928, partial [Rhizoclosmatium sp. JEL0117]
MSLCTITPLANTPRAFALNSTLYQGSSTAITSVSPAFSLDGPKILPAPNANSYQWWHFDAVGAPATPGSITLTFFSAPETAFQLGNPSRGNLAVLASASLPNGTIVASLGVADISYVLPEKEWSSGDYGAMGGWCGSKSGYVVNVNVTGFVGSLQLKKTAPAHYGCGISTQTSDATWAPGIYWSNAVPDAEARASFTFADGTKLSFDGRGYHDNNWGISPLFKNMIGEYWGHAALGPFSIVWSLVIGVDGKNYTSAYVSRNGVVLASSCQPTDFTMTVQGGTTFPPTIPTQVKTSSFGLSFVLPNGDGVLDVVVNKLAIAMLGGKGVFIRWTGSAK